MKASYSKKYRPRNATHWRWRYGGMIYFRGSPFSPNGMVCAYLKPVRGQYKHRNNGGGKW